MKVFPFKIPKTKEESLIYHEDREVVLYDKLHLHEEIQISYIEEGEGNILVGDTITEYQKGDLLVIGSNLPHVFRSEKNAQTNSLSILRSIFFTTDSFGKDFFDLPEFKILYPFFESVKNGFIIHSASPEIVKKIIKFKDADEFNRFIIFFKLLKNLCYSDSTPLSSFIYEKKINDTEGKRMHSVFEYVMSNYQKNITLEEIANISNMSKNAFCRYFKMRTNKTFFQFLIEIRIERAGKFLLKHKELSVIEIAELCGFNNISNFNRKFKEIKNISPLQYRKMYL